MIIESNRYLVRRKRSGTTKKHNVRDISKPKPLVQAEDLINYWNKQGLRQHSKPNSKIYRDILRNLTQLLSGNHPHFNRKFDYHEIIEAIDSFVQAAIDPSVKPFNKKRLRNTSFLEFIYCPYAEMKSKLSYYMIHEPEPLNSCKDRYPKMTKALMKVWNREMRHGMKNGYSAEEKNQFRKASNKIMDMIEENKEKIQWLLLTKGPEDIAEALWRSIEESVKYNLNRVNVFWLSSDLTLSKFCDYLAQKGYVKARNEI